MKKFAVVLCTLLFCAGIVFAGDTLSGGSIDSGNNPTGNGNQGNTYEREKISFDEYVERMKEEGQNEQGQTGETDGDSIASTLILPKIALINSSILSNEVANVILDNTGNYTFFQKQGSNAGDVEDRSGVTMYIKGFGGQEKLDLKNYDYTKFENTYYGAILGLDWDRQ